jgi:hypothetical protein
MCSMVKGVFEKLKMCRKHEVYLTRKNQFWLDPLRSRGPGKSPSNQIAQKLKNRSVEGKPHHKRPPIHAVRPAQ